MAHSLWMPDATQPSLADHLNALKVRAGMSLDEIAHEGGYKGRSSVQRYFNDHSIVTLQPMIAERFARAFYGKGNPPIDFKDMGRLLTDNLQDLDEAACQSMMNLLGIKRAVQALGPSSVEPVRSGMMPVMGVAHATNWMESSPSLDEPEVWLAVPFHSYQPAPGQYALRIVGPSLDKIAPEGHYAICQKIGDARNDPPNGRFVHVERSRGDFVEWTIKQVRWDSAGVMLAPYSNHADHKMPIPFGNEGDSVRILGIVTGWYCPA